MSESLIKGKLNSAKFKDIHNDNEWTPALDEILKKAVLTHYFNFNLVSLDVNDEASRLGIRFGATNAYTNEKCRIRWFYIHCKRSLELKDKQKKAKKEERKIKQQNKENKESKFEPQVDTKPYAALAEKTFKEDLNNEAVPSNSSKAESNTTSKIKGSKAEKPHQTYDPVVDIYSIPAPEPTPSNDEVRELWEQKEIREDK